MADNLVHGAAGGSTAALRRQAGLVRTVNPGHSTTSTLPPVLAINGSEICGEYFELPQPGELIFISGFSSLYHHSIVRRAVANGLGWTFRGEGVQPDPLPAPEDGIRLDRRLRRQSA